MDNPLGFFEFLEDAGKKKERCFEEFYFILKLKLIEYNGNGYSFESLSIPDFKIPYYPCYNQLELEIWKDMMKDFSLENFTQLFNQKINGKSNH